VEPSAQLWSREVRIYSLFKIIFACVQKIYKIDFIMCGKNFGSTDLDVVAV